MNRFRSYSFFICSILLAGLLSCNTSDSIETKPDSVFTTNPLGNKTISLQENKQAVLAINQQVINIFKERNYLQLPPLVHPIKGVRFSQYGFVDTANDQGFAPTRLQDYLTNKQSKKLDWGSSFDGTNTSLSVPEYLAKKVYRFDFSHADSVGYNIIFRTGSSIDIMEAVYGHAPFVSNYFKGFDKKNQGLDWQSLRLIFEQYDGKYYLVGVINDQWTP